jgi:predicted RNA-binding Zn-ribbon protein involved in translation (DUF1610 family)
MPKFFPTRCRNDRPSSLEVFTSDFPDGTHARTITPAEVEGSFKCPRCGWGEGWRLESGRGSGECKGVHVD